MRHLLCSGFWVHSVVTIRLAHGGDLTPMGWLVFRPSYVTGNGSTEAENILGI